MSAMKRYRGIYEVYDAWSNKFIDGFVTEERARAYCARNEHPASWLAPSPRYIVLPVARQEEHAGLVE
jgi:hypothetical protein